MLSFISNCLYLLWSFVRMNPAVNILPYHMKHVKNYQGGMNQKGEESQDKRMYATGEQQCPVESVKLFLQKTDPSATALFNHCNTTGGNQGN